MVSNSCTFVLANTMKLPEQKDKRDQKKCNFVQFTCDIIWNYTTNIVVQISFGIQYKIDTIITNMYLYHTSKVHTYFHMKMSKKSFL